MGWSVWWEVVSVVCTVVDLVVMGLGYVGLPLVREAVAAGLTVAGYDIDARKVDALNAGRSHVDDVSDAEVSQLLAGDFVATTQAEVLDHASAVLICVPTPLTLEGAPDLTAIEHSAQTVAAHLHPGMLVVLESTTYPGTTDEFVLPILEATGLRVGSDFNLAYSPERIDPGNVQFGLRNTPKVVGGVTPICAEVAQAFYGKLVDEVVLVKGTREAEMAKLLENTYRHINIALMNEMAVFCDELDIDLWESIRAAATKPFGFQAFRPGAGVGGHCIPIDPSYLSYKVRALGYPFRFVELAQEINARMPAYVVARVQRLLNDHARAVRGSKILLLGVTYKADIADERESPAQPVAKRLLELGAEVSYHDPYVRRWHVNGTTLTCANLESALEQADLVVLLQHHTAYDGDRICTIAKLCLDTTGRLGGERVRRL